METNIWKNSYTATKFRKSQGNNGTLIKLLLKLLNQDITILCTILIRKLVRRGTCSKTENDEILVELCDNHEQISGTIFIYRNWQKIMRLSPSRKRKIRSDRKQRILDVRYKSVLISMITIYLNLRVCIK